MFLSRPAGAQRLSCENLQAMAYADTSSNPFRPPAHLDSAQQYCYGKAVASADRVRGWNQILNRQNYSSDCVRCFYKEHGYDYVVLDETSRVITGTGSILPFLRLDIMK